MELGITNSRKYPALGVDLKNRLETQKSPTKKFSGAFSNQKLISAFKPFFQMPF